MSKIKYLGDLRTEATHLASGNTIITDAPLDNKGKGQAFSPTDLMSSALASCMLTIMGISANAHHINIVGAEAGVTKIMASNPRKVAEVQILIKMPPIQYTDKEKKILENAARTCPVALSINPDIVQKIEFAYSV